MKVELVSREIRFYNVNLYLNDPQGLGDQKRSCECFTAVNSSLQSTSSKSYQQYGGVYYCLNDIVVNQGQAYVTGRILSIRTDIFPSLHNLSTALSRSVGATANEGIEEITHFALSFGTSDTYLAMEYNHYGPKVGALLDCINHTLTSLGCIQKNKSVGYQIVVNTATTRQVINAKLVKSFHVRVHKNHIAAIQNVDSGIASALQAAHSISDGDKVLLDMQLDWRHRTQTSKIKTLISKVYNSFKTNPRTLDLFEQVIVEAQDPTHGDKIMKYDLLEYQLKVKVKIEVRSKCRTLVSQSAYKELLSTLRNNGLL